MRLRTAILSLSLPALLVIGSAFAFQGKEKPGARAHGQDDGAMHGMEMPRPTSEHAWLMERVGTWDCVVHCEMMGGETKATEVNKAFGEFWVVSEFNGAFMGMDFRGMGLSTYDPMKEKFISTWCDTMSPTLYVMEGTLDESRKKLTSTGKGPNMEGKIVEYTNVVKVKGPDEVVFYMYETAKGPDDPSAMRIDYKRRK